MSGKRAHTQAHLKGSLGVFTVFKWASTPLLDDAVMPLCCSMPVVVGRIHCSCITNQSLILPGHHVCPKRTLKPKENIMLNLVKSWALLSLTFPSI